MNTDKKNAKMVSLGRQTARLSICVHLCSSVVPLLLILTTGCNQFDERHFTLEVKNASARPITIGLTKNGPPAEVAWESPEDRAIMDPRNTGVGWGQVLPPGRTAYINNLIAYFSPGTSGFLRIYAGDLPLNDLLAIGRDSRNRIDVRLREGKTAFTVSDKGPYIDVVVTSYDPSGEEAAKKPTIQNKP
jgi:hypothetical protein